jgi:hypothetical protein
MTTTRRNAEARRLLGLRRVIHYAMTSATSAVAADTLVRKPGFVASPGTTPKVKAH